MPRYTLLSLPFGRFQEVEYGGLSQIQIIFANVYVDRRSKSGGWLLCSPVSPCGSSEATAQTELEAGKHLHTFYKRFGQSSVVSVFYRCDYLCRRFPHSVYGQQVAKL